MLNTNPPRRIIARAALALLLAALALLAAAGGADPGVSLAQTTPVVDYDTDDDGLIEVDSYAKLNAIRYDLNGDGQVSAGNATNYALGFPNFDAASCPDNDDPADGASYDCIGYELTADLHLSTAANFTPIAPTNNAAYSAQFHGRGYIIHNLTINNTANDTRTGLFANTNGATITGVGLEGVNIRTNFPPPPAGEPVGGLVGYARNTTIRYCWVRGARLYQAENGHHIGGLVGELRDSTIAASYADVPVATATGNSLQDVDLGGLVGFNNSGTILASYARGNLNGGRTFDSNAGGLVARNRGGTIVASYSTGSITTAAAGVMVGGLVGQEHQGGTTVDSYWDTTTSSQSNTAGSATGQTTSNLKSPTEYGTAANNDIYANWNIDLDNADGDNDRATGVDDPWAFPNADNYPIIRFDFGSAAAAVANAARARQLQLVTDYDADGDDLIEVSTLAQLNAIRWDANGDGAVSAGNRNSYRAAFPRAAAGMGCASGAGMCDGYELTADLDFDTDGDDAVSSTDAYPNWDPLPAYSGIFHGNGHIISNLTIDRATANDVGLFKVLASGSAVRSLGLPDADVKGDYYVGILAGSLEGGNVTASWVGGAVAKTGSTGASHVGGIVGLHTEGDIIAGYSTAAVANTHGGHTSGTGTGGLVGTLASVSGSTPRIIASYAAGAVTPTGSSAMDAGRTVVGGLVGSLGSPASRTALNSQTPIANSYWDTTTTGWTTSASGGANPGTTTTGGYNTAALQSPTAYGTGIYANWNVNVDGVAGNDDPWHFGTSSQYPILQHGRTAYQIVQQRTHTPVDYDADDDNLIDLSNLAQLNAIRDDLNGDGVTATGAVAAAYAKSFPGQTPNMGCPADCAGYELVADLDFDTDGDGDVDGDDPGSYAEWTPIGASSSAPYASRFQGNGHTISNLRLNTSGTGNTQSGGGFTGVQSVGLFGYASGTLEGVGLLDVDIDATYTANQNTPWYVGGLAGQTVGLIRSSYVTGEIDITASGAAVNGASTRVGGLVGQARQNEAVATRGVIASWTDVAITVASTAPTNNAAWRDYAGGLVGYVAGNSQRRFNITASYARGAVTDNRAHAAVAGLVGYMSRGTVTASYAANAPTATGGANASAAGLVATASNAAFTDSYWDTATSGILTHANGDPKSTSDLQSPTGYTGDFANWNVNVDGDTGTGTPTVGGDDPWDFVNANHYPILKYGYGAAGLVRQRTVTVDYDADDDNLIEIDALAQLDAVRHDLDGNGIPANTADARPYLDAFPGLGYGMGCAAVCKGYELTADLDFDENGDGEITMAGDPAYWNNGAGWIPIGDQLTAYQGDFHGNGWAIRNLYSNPTNVAEVGLFGAMWNGTVERVALLDVNLTPTWNAGGDGYVGALVGHTGGNAVIRYTYATGAIAPTASGTILVRAGGLVGQILNGNINASWVDVDIDVTSTSTRGFPDYVGGLVGRSPTPWGVGVQVLASYAVGELEAARNSANGGSTVGGLFGELWNGGGSAITASYAANATLASTSTGAATTTTGGLVGAMPSDNRATVTASYWDSDIGPSTTYGNRGAGLTTANLQPTAYGTTGNNFDWDGYDVDNADGDNSHTTGNDDVWHFATGAYPILKFGYDALGVDRQQGGAGNVDYDADDDNLIDLGGGAAGLARLDAVRYDLDGDGRSVTGDGAVAYAAAFPGLTAGMGCPAGCDGYELTAHLDFDENNDDAITSADAAYWNGGAGWDPIGDATGSYDAKFDGNGYVIDHLFISRSSQPFYVGLFGFTGENAELSNIALPNVNVTGNDAVGALSGTSLGSIATSWSSGSVSGRRIIGGLAGQVGTSSNSTRARLVNTYSSASVSATGPDNPGGAGPRTAGGLVGRLAGSIATSYAAGAVTPTTGTVMGGGLAGFAAGVNAAIAASHWDTQVTGQSASTAGTFTGGTGLNTAGMQSPTAPGAVGAAYAGWDANVWDFGASDQYPVLKYTGRSLAWQGRGGFAWTQNAAPVTALSVDEDPMGSATYQVALAVAPEDDVAVTITPGHADVTIDDNNDGTFTATGTLTFTAANWNTPQDVVLRAADDADVGNIDTELALAAANAGAAETGYDGVTGEIGVTVQDDDTAAITLSVSQLAILEQDTDGTYTVVLSNEPASDVTVSVVSDDTTAITVSPSSLTFNADTTQSNPWNTAQTVTVTAPHDIDDDSETVTLTHTGAGAGSGYENVTATLTVDVTDNDTPNIVPSQTMLTMDEDTDATYDVELSVVPTGDVTVNLTATGVEINDGGGAFASSGTLTFTMANFDTPQTVTIRASNDDDLANRTGTIAHRAVSADDPRYNSLNVVNATVTVTNTETGSIVLSPLPPATLSVTEGASATYTVALDKRPVVDATVTITSSDATALTANPSTLTFTRAGWSATRTQTVTVTAAADSNDDDDDYVLTNAGGGAGSGYESISVDLTATVLDITAPGVALNPNDASRAINQLSGVTYTVTLDAEPAAEVTVAIASNDPAVLVSASSLTFTPGNYNTAQSVSVSAAVDADGYHNAAAVTFTPTMRNVVGTARTLAVVANAPAPDPGAPAPQTRITPPPAGGGAAGYTVDSQTVTVTSNAGVPDGITISTTQALTADLTITLSTPAANVPARGGGFRLNAGSIVDITPSANPPGGLEVCLPRGRDAIMLLRWQDGTWVEVPGSQVRGDQVCAVITQFSVFGAGRRAGAELLRPAANIVFGEGKTAQITVLVQDTTTAPVQVSWAVSGTGNTTPGDFANADHSAALTAFPTGSITIPAGSDQTATISIPIYDDDMAEGAEPFTVRLTQATGGVADYNDEAITARIALSDPSLDLRGPDGAGDNTDTPLTASSRLVITEGRTNTYMMALSAEPAGPVTVVIHSNHDSVTTSPASIEFTLDNWNQPQPVTVNAAPDGDAKNETATLTHILTDADGAVIEIIDQLSVFVADTDPPDDDDVC